MLIARNYSDCEEKSFVFTDQRLTQAYQEAQTIEFTKDSKFIFFSDLHRGDDSISDEFTRNQMITAAALEYYYKKGYTYIEVGDGDELWEYKKFKHIRTAHTDVFTTIKKYYDDHRFIMIYGNHNINIKHRAYTAHNYFYFYDEYKEQQRELFRGIHPVEGVRLKYDKTGQEILVVHGHQGDFFNDQFWYPTMLSLRYFWRLAHLVGFKNPASPAKNQSKRHKIEKRYCKWIKKNKIMLICGHTHRMKYPLRNDLPYFNCGCCIHTKGITGIEISNGKIMLVQWRIRARDDGTLAVVPSVIKGPKPIEYFKFK